MLQRITWPVAFLAAAVAALAFAALVGVPVWLVATSRAPAALLVGPLTGILTACAALATHTVQSKAGRAEAEAAYARGKAEMPDFLTDPAKLAAARSVVPPPLTGDELGGVEVKVDP